MNLDALKVLVPTMLKPNRDGLDAIVSRLKRTDQAQEAWEFVAPRGWVGESARRFKGRDADDRPPTVGAVAAFCVNPEEILRSEALAREVTQRLAPFGGATSETIVWSFWPHALWAHGDYPEPPMNTALAEVVKQVSPSVTSADRDAGKQLKEAGLPDWLSFAATMTLAWERASSADGPLAGKANPFDPLIELAAVGVILHHVDQGAVTLVMPAA